MVAKVEAKKLDHPALVALSGVYRHASDEISKLEKTKKKANEDIRTVLEEFPDDKKFELPGFNITKGANRYSNQATFRQYLIDHGVDPELISAANEAAMTDGDYKLLVTKAKED